MADSSASGSLAFTWTSSDGTTHAAMIGVEVMGIGIDDALDVLADGLAASTDPVYTVTRAQVVETVRRDKRGRQRTKPGKTRATPVTVAEGEPAAVRAERAQ